MRLPDGLYYPMFNSDKITIGKMHSTLYRTLPYVRFEPKQFQPTQITQLMLFKKACLNLTFFFLWPSQMPKSFFHQINLRTQNILLEYSSFTHYSAFPTILRRLFCKNSKISKISKISNFFIILSTYLSGE